MKPSTPESFWAKVDKAGDCWPWRGSVGTHGYGQHMINTKNRRAHRVAYELVFGPIPSGLTLDHLCRNKRCVNPAHLEPVTVQENIRRSDCPSALNARKTHCKRGHEFTPATTYITPAGSRQCRKCQAVRDAKRSRKAPATAHSTSLRLTVLIW